MFQPKYTITPILLANIKRIAELVTELNNRHFPQVVLVDMERRAREISAYSSTSIEGNPLPLTEVKRLLQNSPEHKRDSEREVLNYNHALEHLNKLLNRGGVKFDLSLILDIHGQVTAGLVHDFKVGKIRQEPVFVNNPATGQTVYYPPDHIEVPGLIDDLIKFVNDNKKKIDPLIIAGIFHKQFVVVHPFVDGNGRTTRLATKMLLANMGLNTFNLFSFENYYNNNVTKYFQKVGLLGNYYDLKDEIDFTSWLEYFTDGIIDELLRVGDELAQVKAKPGSRLKPHHYDILRYLQNNNSMTNSDYAGITKRAKPTRNMDIKQLLLMGLIEKRGHGKNTYYVLTDKKPI